MIVQAPRMLVGGHARDVDPRPIFDNQFAAVSKLVR